MSALSAFEVAARLTYHFWQDPPDDELWTAAENGSLLTATVYGAQLDRDREKPLGSEVRSTSSSRSGCGSRSCHHSMRCNADPIFQAFAGAQMPPASARDAMIEDVLALDVEHPELGGHVERLPQRSALLRAGRLCGRHLRGGFWDGIGPPPLFPPPAAERAFDAGGDASDRYRRHPPDSQGLLVRNALLCQQVGAPPPNVNTDAARRRARADHAAGGDGARRRRGTAAAATSASSTRPGSSPRASTAWAASAREEKLFDAQGNVVATLPVDTSAGARGHARRRGR